MLPTLAGGWRASALRGEEAGRFREVAGVSIIAAGGPRSRHFNSRQPSGLNKLNLNCCVCKHTTARGVWGHAPSGSF